MTALHHIPSWGILKENGYVITVSEYGKQVEILDYSKWQEYCQRMLRKGIEIDSLRSYAINWRIAQGDYERYRNAHKSTPERGLLLEFIIDDESLSQEAIRCLGQRDDDDI